MTNRSSLYARYCHLIHQRFCTFISWFWSDERKNLAKNHCPNDLYQSHLILPRLDPLPPPGSLHNMGGNHGISTVKTLVKLVLYVTYITLWVTFVFWLISPPSHAQTIPNNSINSPNDQRFHKYEKPSISDILSLLKPSIFKLWDKSTPHQNQINTGKIIAKDWSGGYLVSVRPIGKQIDNQGWRLRSFMSESIYQYKRSKHYPTEPAEHLLVHGKAQSSDLMIGYQFNYGDIWSKIYVGANREQHQLDKPDPGNKINGTFWGLKLISENWLNISENGFVSFDAAYTAHSVKKQLDASIRTGIKWHQFRVGLEAGLNQNHQYKLYNAGLFTDWDGIFFTRNLGLSLAGGILKEAKGDNEFYGRVSMRTRF